MAGESIGWGGEAWLDNDGGVLTEIVGVLEVMIPETTVDEVETTHMKSPGRVREYISGLKTLGEFTVQMNFVAGSATDLLCQGALADTGNRSFKLVISDDAGDGAWEVTGEAFVKGYTRTQPIGDRKTATITLRAASETTEAAAA